MPTTYAQKQAPAQKMGASSAASVLDASSQSEGLQRKADMANNAAQREEAPRPNNTGMPDNLKSGIESLSGFSMDDVRVHYNSSKPATVQALAYTQGTDIHVAPGQEKHLPHEAWHVAQQMAGRVSPTTNINGMPVNDNAGLEHEADVMGEKAEQYNNNNAILKKTNVSIPNDAKTKQLFVNKEVYKQRWQVLTDRDNNNVNFTWDVKFQLTLPSIDEIQNNSLNAILITVRIFFNTGDLELINKWKQEIQTRVNNRFQIVLRKDGKTIQLPLCFFIESVDSEEKAHHVVSPATDGRGTYGTADMCSWGAQNHIFNPKGSDLAHEFMHMMGALDQYGIVYSGERDRQGRMVADNWGDGRNPNGSIMNNPQNDLDDKSLDFVFDIIRKHSQLLYRGYSMRLERFNQSIAQTQPSLRPQRILRPLPLTPHQLLWEALRNRLPMIKEKRDPSYLKNK